MKQKKISYEKGIFVAKIIRNNKIIEFNRIVAYGCSITSAHESLDHELLYHLGNINAIDELKKQYQNWRAFIPEAHALCKDHIPSKWDDNMGSINWNIFFEDQKKMSYANKLADKFGVPCLNQSMRGSSIHYALFQIENDLANGVLDPTDLILVGLTQICRHFYIDHTDEFHHMLINMCDSVFEKNYWRMFSGKSNMIWNYYRTLSHIEMLNNKHNNILCLTVLDPSPQEGTAASTFFADDVDYMPDRNTINGNRLFNVVKKARDFKTIVNMCINEVENGFPNNAHTYLHPTIQQHEEYAERIFNKIKTEEMTKSLKSSEVKNKEDLIKERLEELRKRDPYIYR